MATDNLQEVQQRFRTLQSTVQRWETEPNPAHLQDVQAALAEAQRTVARLEQEGVYFDHPKRLLHDVVAVATARLELAEQTGSAKETGMTRLNRRLTTLERHQVRQEHTPLGIVVWDDEPVPPVSPGRPVAIIRLPRKLTEAAWVEEAKACRDEHGNINLAAWRARHPAYAATWDHRKP